MALGVLAVGQKPHEPVEWLVSVPPRAPEQVLVIRGYFTRLGGVVVDRLLNRVLKAQLDCRYGDIQTLQGEIANRDEAIQSLEHELQSHQRDIQSLQGAIKALQDTIAGRDGRIASIHQSLSWRLTSLLWAVDRCLKIHQ
jgi:hypothetical protein